MVCFFIFCIIVFNSLLVVNKRKIISRSKVVLVLGLGCLAFSSLAQLQSWYVSGSFGMGLPIKPSASNVANGFPDPDRYTVDKVDDMTMFGLGAGVKLSLNSKWFSNYQVGLEYNNGMAYKTSGKVELYSRSKYYNYDYNYKVSRNTLLLTYQTDIIKFKHWAPHLNAAVGFSRNKASAYQETSRPDITTPRTYSVANKTETQFAYRLGFGASYDFMSYGTVSLDYNYLNAGQASLGKDFAGNDSVKQDLAYNTFSLSYTKYFSF